MRAIQAIFEDGRVFFPFHYPEFEGPVSVLVIFPGYEELLETEEDPDETEPTPLIVLSPHPPEKAPTP